MAQRLSGQNEEHCAGDGTSQDAMADTRPVGGGHLHRALALTWLAYAYFYVLRKTLGAVKSALRHDAQFSEQELASLDTAFLAAYSAGLYVSGCLVDVLPPRAVLVAGLLLAAIAAAALPVLLPTAGVSGSGGLGWLGWLAVWAPAYLCWFAHGLAQSAGHPATQRILGRRLRGSRSSGLYLGIWTTSQTIGGMAGNLAGGLLFESYGWQAVLQFPGLLAPLIVLLLFFGWTALEVPSCISNALLLADAGTEKQRRGWCGLGAMRRMLDGSGAADLRAMPQVYIAALAAFFIKFVRYALLFWLPYYYWAALGYEASKAAYYASIFEFGGFFGSMGIGPLSDRLNGPGAHRRAAPSAALLLVGSVLLGVVCPALQATDVLASSSRDLALGLAIFFVGVCVDGPESVVTGALCNDLCEDSGLSAMVGRVVGVVNGTGILGALLAGPAVTLWARSCGGWRAVFPLLAFISLLGVAALLPLCKFAPQALRPGSSPRLRLLVSAAGCVCATMAVLFWTYACDITI